MPVGLSGPASRSNKYYQCTGKDKQARERNGRACPARFIQAQRLNELVWQDQGALLSDPGQIRQALDRAQGGH